MLALSLSTLARSIHSSIHASLTCLSVARSISLLSTNRLSIFVSRIELALRSGQLAFFPQDIDIDFYSITRLDPPIAEEELIFVLALSFAFVVPSRLARSLNVLLCKEGTLQLESSRER